eukprot:scaffold5259_cov58-Attheya_sp.AAC.6
MDSVMWTSIMVPVSVPVVLTFVEILMRMPVASATVTFVGTDGTIVVPIPLITSLRWRSIQQLPKSSNFPFTCLEHLLQITFIICACFKPLFQHAGHVIFVLVLVAQAFDILAKCSLNSQVFTDLHNQLRHRRFFLQDAELFLLGVAANCDAGIVFFFRGCHRVTSVFTRYNRDRCISVYNEFIRVQHWAQRKYDNPSTNVIFCE